MLNKPLPAHLHVQPYGLVFLFTSSSHGLLLLRYTESTQNHHATKLNARDDGAGNPIPAEAATKSDVDEYGYDCDVCVRVGSVCYMFVDYHCGRSYTAATFFVCFVVCEVIDSVQSSRLCDLYEGF